MRPIVCRWLAISSVLVALAAQGATRPRYGGTLRVETRAAVQTLDVASNGGETILPLIGDTLVALDANGRLVPRLAAAWQSENGGKTWQFAIRAGVFLHNGASLTPAHVAQALAVLNANWKVRAGSDAVTIESELALPDLPAELARHAYTILLRDGDRVVGTGPFVVEDFQSGRRLLLRANDEYWGGRPYLDAVEITMARPLREQAVDLQLGRADVVEIGPEQGRRNGDGQRTVTSWPSELIAIQFARGTGATEEPRLRQAISLAIDRAAIQSVLFQRQGEASAALLPQWVSGYGYLFKPERDLTRARGLRSQVAGAQAAITLGYDAGDELARSVAERVALNARDAGINIQVVPGGGAANVIRIPVVSSNTRAALAGVLSRLDGAELPRVLTARSSEELYAAEREVLEQWRIVPVAHVPQAMALGARVRNWASPREGGWPLADVWMEAGTK